MIDTHCHIHYYENFQDVYNEFQNIVCIWDVKDLLTKPNVWDFLSKKTHSVIGIHPNNAKNTSLDELDTAINTYKDNIIGIGETGIDLHYDDQSTIENQIYYFKHHIKLCRDFNKTLIIHARNCDIDLILRLIPGDIRAVLHSFNFTLQDALKVPDNVAISFSGMLTFNTCSHLIEVAQHIPIEKILIETDSPYLTPCPLRGKPNYPKYVRFIYERIANLRNIQLNELIVQVRANFYKFFHQHIQYN